MNTTTNSNSSVKLVWVAGMLIREDKVEGRLKSLAHGRDLKTQLYNDEQEERRQLKVQEYPLEEINRLRKRNHILTQEAMGLGERKRAYRVRKKA